ncbi:ATP-binding protein [Brevibacillus ginsengisoli]|uniref:ATP-binding protein n=1 Tax=Brevibacillus ginsengisoli TaxID=363854 RepID=UPI003CE74AC4
MIHVQIDCPASIEMVEYLDQICEWTISRYNKLESRKVVLAVHEAIINSVEAMKRRYGEQNTESNISLKIRLQMEEIEVKIIDSAGGLSAEAKERLQNQDFDDLIWEEDGRGLLFIKHLVDEVWQDQDEDGRFVMGLRKRVKQNA